MNEQLLLENNISIVCHIRDKLVALNKVLRIAGNCICGLTCPKFTISVLYTLNLCFGIQPTKFSSKYAKKGIVYVKFQA